MVGVRYHQRYVTPGGLQGGTGLYQSSISEVPLLDDYRHGRAIGHRCEARCQGLLMRARVPRPAQQRAHPCLKLKKTKGFREVTIGPEVEATRLIYVRVASTQQHDRHFARVADPAEDFPPRKVRQHSVQY